MPLYIALNAVCVLQDYKMYNNNNNTRYWQEKCRSKSQIYTTTGFTKNALVTIRVI